MKYYKTDKAYLLNVLIIVFEIIGIIIAYKSMGWSLFTYYTELSNMLLLLASLLYVYYSATDKRLSELKTVKYMATVSVSLTFVVVVLILSWFVEGGLLHILLSGSSLYHHTICPILGIISFTYFEDYDLTNNDVYKSIIPTFVYSIVFVLLNILRIVEGPYPFLMVYEQSVAASVTWFVLILLITAVISLLLRKFHRR